MNLVAISDTSLVKCHHTMDARENKASESFVIGRIIRPQLQVLWCLFIVILVSANPQTSCSQIIPNNQKVKFEIYYETLCPYCSNLIVNYLPDLFRSGLISIVDLKLIPYGNAKIRSNNTIICQHGPTECLLNTIEACAIDVWPDLNEHFPFVYCVESLVYEGKYSQWETCFSKLGLDSKSVIDCYTSGYGKELELKYAADTNALQPPHTYVPWVVVNGQPIYDDYRNFISYICKAYKGSSLPQACSASSLGGMWKKKNSFSPVCYIEQAANSVIQQIRSAIISWIPSFNVAASI